MLANLGRDVFIDLAEYVVDCGEIPGAVIANWIIQVGDQRLSLPGMTRDTRRNSWYFADATVIAEIVDYFVQVCKTFRPEGKSSSPWRRRYGNLCAFRSPPGRLSQAAASKTFAALAKVSLVRTPNGPRPRWTRPFKLLSGLPAVDAPFDLLTRRANAMETIGTWWMSAFFAIVLVMLAIDLFCGQQRRGAGSSSGKQHPGPVSGSAFRLPSPARCGGISTANGP